MRYLTSLDHERPASWSADPAGVVETLDGPPIPGGYEVSGVRQIRFAARYTSAIRIRSVAIIGTVTPGATWRLKQGNSGGSIVGSAVEQDWQGAAMFEVPISTPASNWTLEGVSTGERRWTLGMVILSAVSLREMRSLRSYKRRRLVDAQHSEGQSGTPIVDRPTNRRWAGEFGWRAKPEDVRGIYDFLTTLEDRRRLAIVAPFWGAGAEAGANDMLVLRLAPAMWSEQVQRGLSPRDISVGWVTDPLGESMVRA